MRPSPGNAPSRRPRKRYNTTSPAAGLVWFIGTAVEDALVPLVLHAAAITRDSTIGKTDRGAGTPQSNNCAGDEAPRCGAGNPPLLQPAMRLAAGKAQTKAKLPNLRIFIAPQFYPLHPCRERPVVKSGRYWLQRPSRSEVDETRRRARRRLKRVLKSQWARGGRGGVIRCRQAGSM